MMRIDSDYHYRMIPVSNSSLLLWVKPLWVKTAKEVAEVFRMYPNETFAVARLTPYQNERIFQELEQ